jgi:hypothetical protein
MPIALSTRGIFRDVSPSSFFFFFSWEVTRTTRREFFETRVSGNRSELDAVLLRHLAADVGGGVFQTCSCSMSCGRRCFRWSPSSTVRAPSPPLVGAG